LQDAVALTDFQWGGAVDTSKIWWQFPNSDIGFTADDQVNNFLMFVFLQNSTRGPGDQEGFSPNPLPVFSSPSKTRN